MRWQGRRQSDNVEDRRGMPVSGVAVGGGLVTLLLALLVMFLGGDPRALLQQGAGPGPQQQEAREVDPAEEPLREFVSVVLADTEDVWDALFREQLQEAYRKPTLVLYTERVNSGCGLADAGMGPFYCPADEKVYLDLSFCTELKERFRAPGDFAVAYVLAHEVGHHVQKQLGFTSIVEEGRRRNPGDANALSVRLELQADYLAGVWAHHAERMKRILEAGDVEEGLRAASAVGDDRLQREAQGYANPDSFTHGTSAQRSRWFREGLRTGSLEGAKALFELPQDQL